MNVPQQNNAGEHRPKRIHVKCPLYQGNAARHVTMYVEPVDRLYLSVLESIRSGRTTYVCPCGQQMNLAGDE